MVFTALQSSGEELFFRGYLVQQLAARFRSTLIWALLPSVAFGVVHWNPGIHTSANTVIVMSAFLIGIFATFLVFKTGDLSAAMGLHFANNFFAFMLVSGQEDFGGAALVAAPPIESKLWSGAMIGGYALQIIAALGAILLLLMCRRSPLRLQPSNRPAAALKDEIASPMTG